jgi:hypothetical protein
MAKQKLPIARPKDFEGHTSLPQVENGVAP